MYKFIMEQCRSHCPVLSVFGNTRMELHALDSAPSARATIVASNASAATARGFTRFVFRVVAGEDAPAQFPLTEEKDSVTIGRCPGQDIKLADPYVSREHAQCTRQDEQWEIGTAAAKESP